MEHCTTTRRGSVTVRREGIARLKENGHYAFICTGRSMAAVFDPELLGMGFDGIVAGCGTYVKAGGGAAPLNAEISQESCADCWIFCRRTASSRCWRAAIICITTERDYEIGDTDLYIRSLKKIPRPAGGDRRSRRDLHVNKFSIQCQDPALQPEALERLAEGLLHPALLRASDGAHSAGPHESHRHGRVQPPVY